MKNLEDKEKFIELRAEGYSFDKISEMIKVSKPVLLNWAVELKDEIDKAKTIKKDMILKKYALTQEKILEMLGQEFERVNKEIEKRDLSKVDTIKLLTYRLKLLEVIQEQDLDIRVLTKKSGLDFLMEYAEKSEVKVE